MKTLVNTTLCYIEKDGCYLMLHRTKKQNDYNHDKWIGIGGKFENGESPEDCAIREIREETGLVVEPANLEYCGIVTFVDKSEVTEEEDSAPVTPPYYTEFMHLFRVRKFSGTLLTDCDEGDLEWVPIEKINDLPHWQADEIYLDFLAQNKPFFSIKAVYKNSRLIETFLGGVPYNHFGD